MGTLNIGSYMDYVDEDRGRDFFENWECAFQDMGIDKVLYCSCSYWGYGGSLELDILLNDGRVVSYDYAFDSCCDRLDYSSEQKDIDDDIMQHATFFDDLVQYDSWVDMLPKDPYDDVDENNRKNAKIRRLS